MISDTVTWTVEQIGDFVEAVLEAGRSIGEILAAAKDGKDFAELAKQHSQDSSAPSGGDLGFVSKGQLVPSFEQAAFVLQPGEISNVVETPYGYHIIKLEERRGGGMALETEVAQQIHDHLLEQKVQQALQDHVEALRRSGSVEILIPL